MVGGNFVCGAVTGTRMRSIVLRASTWRTFFFFPEEALTETIVINKLKLSLRPRERGELLGK